jgi:hypothetical protein
MPMRGPVTARWLTGATLGWLVFVAALILLARGIISIATRDGGPVFAPVTLGEMHVEPDVIRHGQPATLLNGYCSEHPETLNANSGGIINGGRVVNLYEGRPDLVDGQRRMDIKPGCTPDRFEIPSVPSTIPPGRWVLKATLTVLPPTGAAPQRITEESPPFEVIPATAPHPPD